MNNKIKLIVNILLVVFIAYESYQVYQLQQRLNHYENTGQLKCQNPNIK